jgi:hypothetical protein
MREDHPALLDRGGIAISCPQGTGFALAITDKMIGLPRDCALAITGPHPNPLQIEGFGEGVLLPKGVLRDPIFGFENGVTPQGVPQGYDVLREGSRRRERAGLPRRRYAAPRNDKIEATPSPNLQNLGREGWGC